MNAVAKYFASIDDGAGSLGPFMMLAQDKAALQTWSVFPFLYSTLLSGEWEIIYDMRLLHVYSSVEFAYI